MPLQARLFEHPARRDTIVRRTRIETSSGPTLSKRGRRFRGIQGKPFTGSEGSTTAASRFRAETAVGAYRGARRERLFVRV